ncbi:MAG: protease-4 [Bacteroidia bacterium]|jgi:protease-4
MKQFFKFMFASAFGLFVGIFLILIVFAIIGASLGGDKKVDLADNTLLTIDLSSGVVDRGNENPMENFNPRSFQMDNKMGLNDILKSLNHAASDDRIKGIYIDMNGVGAGAATTEEIRNALLKFKESGKFILSYGEGYSQKGYFLATVSDEIWLNPEGLVAFNGLGAEIMFYKNLLEKLEVEPQIIRYGKFKSAVEPLMLEKMSEANREQIMTYVGSIWNSIVGAIGESRGISADELNRYANEALIRNADSCLAYNLVDKLIYKDEVLAELKSRLGLEEDDDIESISLARYKNVPENRDDGDKAYSKDRIAVVYATGGIESGKGDHETIGSETISKAIRKARKDENVKAIVLRVNSPGGSALASDVIWREVGLAKAAKPVIVSMGDVAASGGYYIACDATKILASPTTITGSIGVFGVLMNFKGLLNNKLGITIDTIKTNKFANLGSPYRPLNVEEREIIQGSVNEIYFDFIDKVGEGRGMSSADVDSIGQGRVWAGRDAMDIGLIDEYGGLERAIEIAAEEAGLENYRLKELPEQKDQLMEIVAELTGEKTKSGVKETLGPLYPYFKDIKEASEMKGVQARLPYTIRIE